MKWFFLLLLLVNIGLFIWIYPQDHSPVVISDVPTGVERLVLLHELAAETSKDAEPKSSPLAASDEPTEQMLTDRQPQQPPVVETESVMTETEPVPSDSTAEMPAVVESVVDEQAAREEVEDTTPADEPVYQEVVETSEVEKSTLAQAPVEQEIIETEDVEETIPEVLCQSIGPLLKRADADNLSVRLRSLGLEPELHSETRNEQAGYWVMIPPQANRSQAIAIVKRLEAKGISDLWRFTSGDLAHAISLGLFKDTTRANIRLEEVNKQGFDAEVRPRYRQQTLYWLRYGFKGDTPLTDSTWREIENRFPEIERIEMDCEKIATQ